MATVLAVSAVAMSVMVSASAPVQQPPQPLTEAADTGLALVAARQQGTKVEAVSMRTPTRTVVAKPDGKLQARVSLTPQRVQQGDKWVQIDTSLNSDGSPKAAEVGLRFSRGGTAPLVELTKDGKSFSLTWPGTLPQPKIEGRTATYAEVLPGVDLVMAAVASGYDQVIVVKSPEAARNVERVKFGMKTTGLTVKPDGNALSMVDTAGTEVFTVPASLMWDSKKQAGRTPVEVEIGENELTIVPDQKVLTDPSTVFPVHIDPGPRVVQKNGWTTVYYNGTAGMDNGTHWNGHNSEPETYPWVGVNPTARSGRAYEGPALKTRTYFQFDTSFLAGKTVLNARLDTTVVHSPSCSTNHKHDLHLSKWDVSPATNWNNQPHGDGVIGSQHIGVVNGACSGHKGLSFTGFDEHDLDKTGNSTFIIAAANEDDQAYWRKFNPNETVLVVEYNGTPNDPYELGTTPNLAACTWCDGMPYVGDATIRLHTRLSDPDGDLVMPEWHIVNNDRQGAVKTEVRWGPDISSGEWATTDVDLTGFHNRQMTWWVKAHDNRTGSANFVRGPSDFIVDRVKPANEPGVTSALYPDDNRWHGGASVPGSFTFTANDDDVNHFAYGWDDATTQRVDADRLGGNATVTLMPPGDGPRDLFVRSVDRAGNKGPAKVYHFYVRAGNGAIAQWSLDGNVQDSAHLGERHGTTHGNTSYVAGAIGSALSVRDGGHASAPNAVRTDTSFSASAWVKLDEAGSTTRTAVSQDGDTSCGFCLQYQGDTKRWAFVMPRSNVQVRSLEEPSAGVWTHLTGVYDASAKQVRLYVNGEPQGVAVTASAWHAAGLLRMGQGWLGGIDEVRMYDRPLSDVEVRAEVRRDNVQAGHWRFEEESGTRAPNSVRSGEAATLSGGAEFFVQRTDGEVVLNRAVRFDGTGQARTTGSVVRTNTSFTVSASVQLNSISQPMTMLSQDGVDASGFVLQQKDGRWLFGLTESNASTKWNVLAQSGPNTAVANTPTHLTGVFNSATKKATLYVNGQQVAVSAEATKPFWDAAGSFVMGRELNGELDEVRAYNRSLAEDEVRSIVALDTRPSRQWHLDATGADTSGQKKNAAVGNPVDWVTGQSNTSDPKDLAARLHGKDGSSLRADHAIDTSRSFSVSTWARLDSLGGNPAVLSQDGDTTSGFQLQATTSGHWAFTMYGRDVNGGGDKRSRATGTVVQVGVWTHLAAVYDADRDRMALYVNGVEAGSVIHANAWDYATGAFRMGQAQWNGTVVDHFTGAIDDVETYSRVLFSDEISDKAGRDLNLVHKWQFDEGLGTAAGDSVGGKAGTLSPGANYAAGRVGNAVRFDGTAGAVSTDAKPRTDENFTVSAWVYLPSDGCTASRCKRVAVSQDGERNSKFRLGYVEDRAHPLGHWLFEMPEDDTDTTQLTAAAVSLLPSDFGKWVHLAGAYDRSAKRLLLYVDGNRFGEGELHSPWQPTGAVQIGRGRLAGAPAEHWPGSVDDVRIYTGALDNESILALHKSYPADNQPAATLPVADAGHWTMNEMSGTTAADTSGWGNTVTFSGGSGWQGGRTGGSAWLDGADDSGKTVGPVVDTSRSFSVATWVYAYQGISGNRGIVGQDGSQSSSFSLHYNGDSGKWGVVMPKADQAGAASTLVLSTEAAPIAKWTHLTTVYDAEAKQLRLYVNGVLSGVQVGVIGWKATGPLTIGRTKWSGGYFPKGIDDVRVFSRALTDGEVGKVHDDVSTYDMGHWPFDGTGNDMTWRKNDFTFTGTTRFEPGVIGQAIKLDGSSSGTGKVLGASTGDSFTVSAWAKLSREDRNYTVVGQDGNWMSGFVLQYRSASKRWAFGAHVQDAENSPLVFASATELAALNDWTHLAGVYNHDAGQLRLYVDGKLAGTQNNVRMWPAEGPLTIGRGLAARKAADQFAGSIDDVRIEQGVQTEARLLERASWPAPAPGQLGRFVNERGDHYTGSTDVPAPVGYRFQGTLGLLVNSEHPNTRILYTCKAGNDMFTSVRADCENQVKIGEAGRVYTVKPTNIPTIPLYRCNTGTDHFESLMDDCEGKPKEQVLGYTVAYAPLARYRTPHAPLDHWSSVRGVEAGYRYEGVLGYVLLSSQAGTEVLYGCRDGADSFSSLDANCEGKTKLGGIGWIWTPPPPGGKELSRCKQNGYSNRLDSTGGCEGQEVQRRLGYLLSSVPAVEPTFPTA